MLVEMQNRAIVIETKQQLSGSFSSELLELPLLPSLPWELLGSLAGAGR